MRVLQIRYDESEIWVVKFKRLGDRWEVKERVTTSGDRTVSSYNSCFFFFFGPYICSRKRDFFP